MWPFSSSNQPPKPSPDESAPTREVRTKCWNSRDEFFACLDASNIISPDAKDRGDKCSKEQATYEENCAKSWVSMIVYGHIIDDTMRHMSYIPARPLT